MKTTLEQPIATLKAEFVNEFEFIPSKERKSRFSDEMVITHPYTSNYKAKVAVKVGNAVKELLFCKNHHYTSSHTTKDGTYISGQSYDYLGLVDSSHPFKELEEAGLFVDYLNVLIQYQDLVEEAKYRETLIKRHKNWQNIRKAKASLANSWIHSFEAIIKADKNKKIVEAVKETTFAPSTNYKEKHNVKITYKGVVVPIHKVDGSFAFNNEKYEYGMDPADVITKNKADLEEGKLRRAKREGTLFLKAIEAIDYRNERMANNNKARRNEIKEREEYRLKLEEVGGYPVIMEEERKYSRDRHSNYSWLEANYFLLLEQPENYYTSQFKKISVSISKHYKTGEYEYGVRSLVGLRPDQFKTILDVLVDGREILPKMIRPKNPDKK